MARLNIRHVTTYTYPQAVRFGDHRLLFRPRDSHDLRLVSSTLLIEPAGNLRWLHDVFSNSIAVARFSEESRVLRFESDIVVDHYGVNDLNFPLADFAQSLPFDYPSDEIEDLRPTMVQHFPDPDGHLAEWTSRFLGSGGASSTMDVLDRMVKSIRDDFTYAARDEPGVQSPVETLQSARGSCRDYALLMMEACRYLGLAARFVTGYLYDPALEGGPSDGTTGAGATHAWCQVYLPGMGWTEFDPTNGAYTGTNLIRIGVGRTPDQAMPVQGSYFGDAGGDVTMTVEVQVTKTKS
ncbi:transglutaminase family protein [Fodinicurvata sp. EGI_FJ10296]|uniref:transglutaminase family protein n=1 Tax=Fodinicurvata sp. EGI_FJ10296 TaxID=3231908 RepID=UPI003453CAC2